MAGKKKSRAQVFLERVEMYDAIIESKLAEKKQWEELALNITSNMGGERVQASGSMSRMADAVDKCLDIENEIDAAVDKFIDAKKEVVRTLEKMTNPTEYKILHMRYIKYISLTDIADMMSREYTWVTTTHGRGLKSVQMILDENKRKKQEYL